MTPYVAADLSPSRTRRSPNCTSIRPAGKARVQWSTAASSAAQSVVTHSGSPRSPAIRLRSRSSGTYLIFSEVNYLYTPDVGYVMAKTGVNLSDVAYTRPRQSACVIYPTPTFGRASRPVRHHDGRDALIGAVCARSHRQIAKGRAISTAFLKAVRSTRPSLICRSVVAVLRSRPLASRDAGPSGNRLVRRRADCRPKTCQSGDPPRSRRRSSGLHAAFQGRRARRR